MGCVWLQVSRNSKGNGEGSKKPKAQDLAQWFNKKRLASQGKSDIVASKVLKRKVPDSEEKAEHSKAKSLKCKAQKTRLGGSESKGLDAKKASVTDGKEALNAEAGAASKASTTSGRLVL